MDPSCHEHQPKSVPWYRHSSVLMVGFCALLIMISYALPFLTPFRESFFMYLGIIWWAILLGLLIGGLIDYYVPQKYIPYYLAAHKKRSILYSVLFGFLMSVCSHGILAIAMEMYKKGASTASIVAFLLASPWANLPLTFLLIGFFGLKAFFFIFGAIGIAIVTGLIFQVLERKGWVEFNPAHVKIEEHVSVVADVKQGLKDFKPSLEGCITTLKGIGRGAVSLSDMVLLWILLGTVLASLVGAYLPRELFNQYMGPNFSGLLVTLGVATVMEVCSEGTAPLAFELYRLTGAFGNAFVFLMAGVVTDYTEIGLLWKNIGHKTALWLPVIAVPQVIVLGIVANAVF